jgi:hypothetical protein
VHIVNGIPPLGVAIYVHIIYDSVARRDVMVSNSASVKSRNFNVCQHHAIKTAYNTSKVEDSASLTLHECTRKIQKV